MSSDRLVRIATRPCLPTRLKRVFAPTSAHFVRRASKTSWRTCARTAAGDSFQGPSDQRRTGKATTSLARIPRAPRSGISRLTRKFMLGSRPQSKPYPLTSVRGTIESASASSCRRRRTVRSAVRIRVRSRAQVLSMGNDAYFCLESHIQLCCLPRRLPFVPA